MRFICVAVMFFSTNELNIKKGISQNSFSEMPIVLFAITKYSLKSIEVLDSVTFINRLNCRPLKLAISFFLHRQQHQLMQTQLS